MTNDRFREALEVDFADVPPETKKELENLMRIGGYRTKLVPLIVRGKLTHKKVRYKLPPSQKQLDYAWKYLKSL
jgi:hypothetical protein